MDFARECRNNSNHTRRRGAKSFVDDLDFSRGVVLSRAVVLLRSIETKPYDSVICPLWKDTSPLESYLPGPSVVLLKRGTHSGLFFFNFIYKTYSIGPSVVSLRREPHSGFFLCVHSPFAVPGSADMLYCPERALTLCAENLPNSVGVLSGLFFLIFNFFEGGGGLK